MFSLLLAAAANLTSPPFPNKLLQPDSLTNHPKTWMSRVKVCSLYNLMPALHQESLYLFMSRNTLYSYKVTAPLPARVS